MYFLEAAQSADSGAREAHVDVAQRFRDLTRNGVGHDIDEVVFGTRKFIPLVRGDPTGCIRGEGSCLNWFRDQASAGVC